jgi:hypothetical protein
MNETQSCSKISKVTKPKICASSRVPPTCECQRLQRFMLTELSETGAEATATQEFRVLFDAKTGKTISTKLNCG